MSFLLHSLNIYRSGNSMDEYEGELWRFSRDEYERFKESKYCAMMYKDKMSFREVFDTGNHVFVIAGGGIDLDFYDDIFNPFLNGETNEI